MYTLNYIKWYTSQVFFWDTGMRFPFRIYQEFWRWSEHISSKATEDIQGYCKDFENNTVVSTLTVRSNSMEKCIIINIHLMVSAVCLDSTSWVHCVWVLARGTVLCSWARHFTVTVPLSTQVYKWVPTNLILGWDSVMEQHPVQGGVEILTPSRFMLQRPG